MHSSCHYATGMQWCRHIIFTGQMIQHPPFKEVCVMLQRYNHVMKLAILNTWYFPLVIKKQNRKAAMNKLISQRKQKKKNCTSSLRYETCKLPARHYYFNCLPLTGSCEVPFYESSGVCVETCPQNEFGNHTSGQCEPCMCHFFRIAN